jgi:hypothetical protein
MLSKAISAIQPIRAEVEYQFCEPNRLLFDHLPKCAGTSITEYLRGYYPRRFIFSTDGRNPLGSVGSFQSKTEEERFRYKLVTGHLTHLLLDFVHPETTIVTVLRDPIGRVVSQYYYVRQEKTHWLHDEIISHQVSIENYGALQEKRGLNNFYTKHFSQLTESEINRNPDNAVQKAIDFIVYHYDIVGFQNNLIAIAEQLQRSANLRLPFSNHFKNRTRNRLSVENVSDSALTRISEVNSVDLKLYDLLSSEFDNKD